jgi:hypothetical protein
MALLSGVSGRVGESVQIHVDRNGLDRLLGMLGRLRARLDDGAFELVHLFSDSLSGDGDLSESMLDQERDSGARQVHHPKTYSWTDEGGCLTWTCAG